MDFNYDGSFFASCDLSCNINIIDLNEKNKKNLSFKC